MKKIGLALGGGAVLGAAHIGVLRALEEMDVEISYISGASIGAAKLGKLLGKSLGEKKIEEADIPLAVIATDMSNGDKVIINTGSLAQAVMANTCIPGIFSPVEFYEKLLVDGGIVENIPIDTVKKMGADYVIGVDLNASKTHNKDAKEQLGKTDFPIR